MQKSGGESEPSPLEVDMAEQGRKARESAARLEEAGAIGSSASSAEDEEELYCALNGMMPLRCGVSGRQVGPFTGVETGTIECQARKVNENGALKMLSSFAELMLEART